MQHPCDIGDEVYKTIESTPTKRNKGVLKWGIYDLISSIK